mgnify:CR=1 FL=1
MRVRARVRIRVRVRVRARVSSRTGVDGGHVDAALGVVGRGGTRHHVEGRLGRVRGRVN